MGFSIVNRREAAQAAFNQITEFLNASVDSNRVAIVGDMKLSFPLIAGIEDDRLFIWIDVFNKDDDLLEHVYSDSLPVSVHDVSCAPLGQRLLCDSPHWFGELISG